MEDTSHPCSHAFQRKRALSVPATSQAPKRYRLDLENACVPVSSRDDATIVTGDPFRRCLDAQPVLSAITSCLDPIDQISFGLTSKYLWKLGLEQESWTRTLHKLTRCANGEVREEFLRRPERDELRYVVCTSCLLLHRRFDKQKERDLVGETEILGFMNRPCMEWQRYVIVICEPGSENTALSTKR